jgi:hypothetical protein
MFDERLLARVLPRPAQDASAGVLDEIMHLAQSAKYEVAAERAAELLDAGCKDVRAFVAYALGVFAERGPAAVPALFDSIAALLSTVDVASSSARRTIDTTLRVACRTIKAHLDFDERRPEAERRVWAERITPESPAEVLRSSTELRKAIHGLVESPLCDIELGGVTTRLDAYFERNVPEAQEARPGDEVREEPQAVPASTHEPELEGAFSDVAREETPRFARRASDYEGDGATLRVSPALRQFIRKLEAFEYLVSSGALAKAAIVAHDIRNVIAAFDPMVYLPDLLAPHFRLLSVNVDELSPYWEQSSTPGWQALEQLYRVDLDAFVDA